MNIVVCMADILRTIVNRAIALVDRRESPQLNPKQCRCLSVCVTQVRDYLCSGPINIHRQVLERIWRTVKKVERFVIKCSNRDWLVTSLSVGVSEEEIKDFILELRWCLSHVTAVGDRATPPQMALPSDEDIRQDRQSLVDKLDKFLSGTRVSCEKRALASYVQGRLKILEGAEGRPSLTDLLCELELQVPREYKPLGRGGSALVFKTSWLGLDVAMKSLSCCGDTFLREAGALAMVSHPNIVRLYCCYEDRMHQSLVMELMDGSLFDLIHKRRKSRRGTSPFNLDEQVEILLQIVKGMLYLHKNGFAHRDLKSLNILVSEPKGSDGDLIVKVADFELVKLFDPSSSNLLTVSHKMVGTHVWRAPEVLNGNAKIKPRRADVYSFGMVFYEILTGKTPYYEKTEVTTTKILHELIVRQGLRPPVPNDCPSPLKALIQQCWHANPELRPTFEEIHDRLLEFRSTMLETSIVETQEVQVMISQRSASNENRILAYVCRALMLFAKIWGFFLSLCNKNHLQINNKLHQLFSFNLGPLIKMWEYFLPLRMNHTEVDSQMSNSFEETLEYLSREGANDQAPTDLNHALNLMVEDLRGLDNMDVLQHNFMGNLESMRRQRSCGCNRTNCPLCTMWFLEVNT